MMSPVTVASFYHFFDIADLAGLRASLLAEMKARDVKGTILLAREGFNGTISGGRESVDAVIALLPVAPAVKYSACDAHPFARTKVKLKKEIITFGYEMQGKKTGAHVSAGEWNRLVADKNVTVLDARNAYESHVGTFDRALTPPIRSFTQIKEYIAAHLDPKKHRRIATFCTGGVRCEKLSAWMLEEGFEEVYQLDGGILKYIEDTAEADSAWHGECFVFDERVAVDHALDASETVRMCTTCGSTLMVRDRAGDTEPCRFCAGLSPNANAAQLIVKPFN